MRPEKSPKDSPGGVIRGMEEADGRPIVAEPAVGTAVPLHEESELRPPRPAASMLGRTAAPFRTDPGLAQPAANRLPADPEAFPPLQHLDEVGVVELGVDLPVKDQDPLAELGTSGVWGSTPPVAMDQALGSISLVSGQEPFGLAVADLHHPGRRLQRNTFPHDLLEDLDPLQLTLAQDNCLFHVRLLGGDILAWQLQGTFMLGSHTIPELPLLAPGIALR
jgi:hypothetical protein